MAQTEAAPRPPPGLGGGAPGGPSAPEAGGCDAATAEERFRRDIVSEIEAGLQSKIDDIMKQGRQMVQRESKQWKEKFDQVTTEMSACRHRVQELSAENVELRRALLRITERLWPQPGTPGLGLSPLIPPSPPEALTGFGETDVGAGAPKLPPVPEFPVPYTPGGSPPASQQILLAEYLGDAPAPVPSPKASSPGDRTFSFTLRKADGADLGLSVSHDESEQTLRVEGIKEKGAVEAWNKQCNAGGTDKAVLPKDHIVSVNAISYDPQGMLAECRDKQLLRLTILRRPPGADEPPPPPEPPRAAPATTLRADASVFVPGLQSPGSSGPTPSASTDSGAESASQTAPVRV